MNDQELIYLATTTKSINKRYDIANIFKYTSERSLNNRTVSMLLQRIGFQLKQQFSEIGTT